MAEERSSMESSSLVFLPGFQFHPTDGEIIFTYLNGKVNGYTNGPGFNFIGDNINLYEKEPSELPDLAPITGHKKMYFFTYLEKKFGNVINRQTNGGYWKKTGKSTDVKGEDGRPIVINGNPFARKTSLAFYKKGGIKSQWLMKEYMLLHDNSKMLSPWTLCVVYDKFDANNN